MDAPISIMFTWRHFTIEKPSEFWHCTQNMLGQNPNQLEPKEFQDPRWTFRTTTYPVAAGRLVYIPYCSLSGLGG